jgi:hypothetical protein
MLADAAAPAELRAADVSFLTPEKTYTPAGPTLDLFLFAVHENRDLRNPETFIEQNAAGLYVRSRPPVRVDCTYLVTAWSILKDALKIQQEHRLLALALAWISRYPRIPAGMLQGAMAAQTEPPPVRTAQLEERLNLSEFWNALGIPPRAGFTVTVTVALDLAVSTPEGPPVVTKDLRFYALTAPETLGVALESQFQIAGTVRDAASRTPIRGAEVTLVELSRKATTEVDGRFSFTIPQAGNYHLSAIAAGHSQADLAITVPGAALNSYDISMAP